MLTKIIFNSIACITVLNMHATFCMDNNLNSPKQPQKTALQKKPSIEFFKKHADGYYSLKKLPLEDVNSQKSGYFLIVPQKGLPLMQKNSSCENPSHIIVNITEAQITHIKKTPLVGGCRGAIIVTIDGKPYPIISIDDQRTQNVTTTIAEPIANSKPNKPVVKQSAAQQTHNTKSKKALRRVARSYRNFAISCVVSSILLMISLCYYFHPESFKVEWLRELGNNFPIESPIQ